MLLVEGQSILPSFDQKLRDFAERKMGQRKNFDLLKDFVVEVGDGYVKLKSGDVIQTGLVVWSTGLAPRPFTGIFIVYKSLNCCTLLTLYYLSQCLLFFLVVFFTFFYLVHFNQKDPR